MAGISLPQIITVAAVVAIAFYFHNSKQRKRDAEAQAKQQLIDDQKKNQTPPE